MRPATPAHRRPALGLTLEDGTSLRLSIEDNGRGFDPARRPAAASTRVWRTCATGPTHMGGRSRSTARPERGARIIVRVPARRMENLARD